MTLPPVQIDYSKLALLTRKRGTCSPAGLTKAQLLKIKDETDNYLEMKWKGLTKEEAAGYRNSYQKNICIDMLQHGYHKSFCEFFALLKMWHALREAGGIRSIFWMQTPLEELPEKLDQLYFFLTRAEDAELAGRYEEMYNNIFALARYFDNPDDKWLRDYFYGRCFKIGQLIKIDGGRKLAEAYANMGLLHEENGNFEEAAKNYEAFSDMTEGRLWQDTNGHLLNSIACENLRRIYTLLAEKMLKDKQYKQAIRTLLKACERAKQGGDKKMEGEAAFALGLAYHSTGEYELAKSALEVFADISIALDDAIGLSRAYEAIGKVLVSQGKPMEAVAYLEKVVEIARNTDQKRRLVEACTLLGDIYNAKGFYTKACAYFKQAFDTTSELRNIPLVDETKVHYGIAKAHQMMTTINKFIESADHNSLNNLLAWKANRTEFFPEATVDKSSDSQNERPSIQTIPESDSNSSSEDEDYHY
ncbi:tetratricopeptide repeat protein 29 isoform X1 [Antechinus flavipes]|uniref:tetratricopeptide repeat protein 29 isoform X1 n=1 Tax=Antechinus flavipes TaxID=38775 RepID=UPI0022354F50|nr:tetratricopeptide repeat protein 29 isoform X1 [Antechinus flavipes]XP_051820885.1 tetratricopeptide repeat protein 29 isoform X1 [Antechinus flavipes]